MTASMMRTGVILEERFRRLPNGQLFSPGGFSNDIWARYVREFGRIVVIARVEDTDVADPSWAEITLPGVEFSPIAPFLGPAGFLRNLPRVLASFRRATDEVEAMIVRAPGTLAILASVVLHSRRKPFAVEVVGDPIDVFGAGIGGRLGPLLRFIFARNLRWLCMHADGVSYVTRDTLQRRYPAKSDALAIAVSDVQVAREVFATKPRAFVKEDDPQVFCAASLEVPYKGIDVLLEALAAMPSPPRLRLGGDGRLRAQLEAQALRLGLSKRVVFLGRLSRDEVLSEMRRCDLYVQPSLTEGLPRAVIEAMATAAPVIGSNVGGLPELLPPEDMVPPGNVSALAALMQAVLETPQRLSAMSAYSLSLAQDYEASLLEERRRGFYAGLRACGEKVAL